MFNKRIKALLALSLAFGMMFSTGVPDVQAAGVIENVLTEPGDGSVPVPLTTEAAVFSVTVPTKLPIHVDQYGEITYPTDGAVKIVNDSPGAVRVTDISLTAKNDWSIGEFADMTLNLPNLNAGTKLFALDILGATSDGEGSMNMTSSTLGRIPAAIGDATPEVEVDYAAVVPVQIVEITDEEIAAVTFTIDWDRGETVEDGDGGDDGDA